MNKEEYVLKLNMDELSAIGAGLNQVPYGIAKPIIEKIEAQVNAQLKKEAPVTDPLLPVEDFNKDLQEASGE